MRQSDQTVRVILHVATMHQKHLIIETPHLDIPQLQSHSKWRGGSPWSMHLYTVWG